MHHHCHHAPNGCYNSKCLCSCQDCRESRHFSERQEVSAARGHCRTSSCGYPCRCECYGCAHQRRLFQLTDEQVAALAKRKVDSDLEKMFRELETPVEPEKKKETKEKHNMATNKSFSESCDNRPTLSHVGDVLRRDLGEAAWRTAGATVVDALHQPLVAAVTAHAGSERAQFVAAFLATDEGRALLGTLLGMAPLVVPQLATDARVEKLAQEMRIQGLQKVSDRVARDLAQPIIDAFTKAVAGLPELPTVDK